VSCLIYSFLGGQRNERKKWVHAYDDVDAVIFVAALSQYNEICFEDLSTNKLMESLNLIEEMGHVRQLMDVPFYLYLNKQDIFMQELTKENLSHAFSEIPKELNTKYKSEKKIDRFMSFNTQLKQKQSWIDIKVVGSGRKLEDLSEDILCHILTFLKFNEVAKISSLNSSFYDILNSDELWMWFCQFYEPNINHDLVKKASKMDDPFPMWKNYFVKAKEIYRWNEFFNVDKFTERFPRKFRGIYITNAVDDSVKDVLTKTFDSVLKLEKRSK
jgi:hypothetical protein